MRMLRPMGQDGGLMALVAEWRSLSSERCARGIPRPQGRRKIPERAREEQGAENESLEVPMYLGSFEDILLDGGYISWGERWEVIGWGGLGHEAARRKCGFRLGWAGFFFSPTQPHPPTEPHAITHSTPPSIYLSILPTNPLAHALLLPSFSVSQSALSACPVRIPFICADGRRERCAAVPIFCSSRALHAVVSCSFTSCSTGESKELLRSPPR